MLKLWGLVYNDNKIMLDNVSKSENDDIDECITLLCQGFDMEKPVMLTKHTDELSRFGRTAFLPGDFMDSVCFDRFVIEILRDKKEEARK